MSFSVLVLGLPKDSNNPYFPNRLSTKICFLENTCSSACDEECQFKGRQGGFGCCVNRGRRCEEGLRGLCWCAELLAPAVSWVTAFEQECVKLVFCTGAQLLRWLALSGRP